MAQSIPTVPESAAGLRQFLVDRFSLDDLKDLAEQARATGGWAILMIHGVGAEQHELYVETDVHERFVGWLAEQDLIWTAPVRTIARYLKRHAEGT